MTDRDVIYRKLSSLGEQIERLRRRRSGDLTTFLRDVDQQDALAMSLLVAVQDAMDIALHMCSDESWGIPASYSDGFNRLEAHGVISAPLAQGLTRMATLRSRIAHGYASVDQERIWNELPAGLVALEGLVLAIAGLLEQP